MKFRVLIFLMLLFSLSALYSQNTRMQDSIALISLFNDLRGENWDLENSFDFYDNFNSLGFSKVTVPNADNTWDFSQPIDTWFGITLNGEGNVIGIELPSIKGGRGRITKINIPSLKKLVLRCLGSTDLTGDIAFLNELKNLEFVRLSNNSLNGRLSILEKNENLKELNLSGNYINEGLTDFSMFPNLLSLYVGSNCLNQSIPDINLEKLKYLGLEGNQLSGNIPDFDLPELVYLSLSRNLFTGKIPNFSKLNKLETLELGYIESLDDHTPGFNLPNLKTLFMEDCGVSFPGKEFYLGDMPKLITLDLSQLDLQGSIPNFSNSADLRYIDISRCNLGKETMILDLMDVYNFHSCYASIEIHHNCLNRDSLNFLIENRPSCEPYLDEELLEWVPQRTYCNQYISTEIYQHELETIFVPENSDYQFELDYQFFDDDGVNRWYEDDRLVATTYGKEQLLIENFRLSNGGDYHVEISYPEFPKEKYWQSEKIQLRMQFLRVNQQANTILYTTCDSSFAQINLSPISNIGQIEYQWNDGFTGPSRTNLSIGEYEVTITDQYQSTIYNYDVKESPDYDTYQLQVPFQIGSFQNARLDDSNQILTVVENNRTMLEIFVFNKDTKSLSLHPLSFTKNQYSYRDAKLYRLDEDHLLLNVSLNSSAKRLYTLNNDFDLLSDIIYYNSDIVVHPNNSSFYTIQLVDRNEFHITEFDTELNIVGEKYVDLPFDYTNYGSRYKITTDEDGNLYVTYISSDGLVVLKIKHNGQIEWSTEFEIENPGYLRLFEIQNSKIYIFSFHSNVQNFRFTIDLDGNNQKFNELEDSHLTYALSEQGKAVSTNFTSQVNLLNDDPSIVRTFNIPLNQICCDVDLVYSDGKIHFIQALDDKITVLEWNDNAHCVSKCDSLELVKFYTDLNGDAWVHTWNTDNSLQEWYGISIDPNGCIIDVNLENNNLSGCLDSIYTWITDYAFSYHNNPLLPLQGVEDLFQLQTSQKGAPCDDGNDSTTNDVIDENCECTGKLETNSNEASIYSSFKIYPNPFTHSLNLDSDFEGLTFKIINSHGKEISSGYCDKLLDLSFLPSGIYIMNIEDSEQTILKVEKLVKI